MFYLKLFFISPLLFFVLTNNCNASEDVTEVISLNIKFSEFSITIHDESKMAISQLYLTGNGTFESADINIEDALWYESWVCEKTSILLIGHHLLIGGKYYSIENPSKNLWLINDRLIDPEKGLINESEMPGLLKKDIEKASEECRETIEGLNFVIEKCFLGGSGFRKHSETNWEFIIGDKYFKMIDSNLYFDGNKLGEVKKGSTVTVSKSLSVSITTP